MLNRDFVIKLGLPSFIILYHRRAASCLHLLAKKNCLETQQTQVSTLEIDHLEPFQD